MALRLGEPPTPLVAWLLRAVVAALAAIDAAVAIALAGRLGPITVGTTISVWMAVAILLVLPASAALVAVLRSWVSAKWLVPFVGICAVLFQYTVGLDWVAGVSFVLGIAAFIVERLPRRRDHAWLVRAWRAEQFTRVGKAS